MRPSISAPAKINLGLHVLGVREDGFHEIETILLPIGWADQLTYEESDTFSLTCSDPTLPTDERNIVWKAAEALASVVDEPMTGVVNLIKNVPYGAGLGSGSSDAATALKLLRGAWDLPISDHDLLGITADLGSDVPFFIEAVPAVAKGRGEILEPLQDAEGNPYDFPFSLVVAVPDVHISTKAAYRWVSPRKRATDDLGELVRSNDLAEWRERLRNDFQEPVVERFSEVGQIIRTLEESGAGYVSLSGSGSAVFGVFKRAKSAAEAAKKLELGGCRIWIEKGSRI